MPTPGHANDEDTLGKLQPLCLITPSPRLVQTPMDSIDSMLLHAWCHLKEHHHGKQYDRLLDHTLPEWRERRQMLNRVELY